MNITIDLIRNVFKFFVICQGQSGLNMFYKFQLHQFFIGNKYCQLFSFKSRTIFIFLKMFAKYLSWITLNSLSVILSSKTCVLWKKVASSPCNSNNCTSVFPRSRHSTSDGSRHALCFIKINLQRLILIQSVWGGAWDSEFLTSSQVTFILLVHGTQFDTFLSSTIWP